MRILRSDPKSSNAPAATLRETHNGISQASMRRGRGLT